MTDWTNQGVAFQVGDGASPEVFTTIADIMEHDDLSILRSDLENTKLNSNVKTAKPGLREVGNFTFSGTYDPNNATVASLQTKVEAEDQADTNFKLDLDTSPNEVWSFQGYVKEWHLLGNAPDGLLKFRAVLKINSVPTRAAT